MTRWEDIFLEDYIYVLYNLLSCDMMYYELQQDSCCTVMYTPFVNHLLGSMLSLWAHLLNMGSLWPECLLIMWFKNDLNLAHITMPLPLNVEVALQCKWFSQGLIHGFMSSQFFSFAIFNKTLRISIITDEFCVRMLVAIHKIVKLNLYSQLKLVWM